MSTGFKDVKFLSDREIDILIDCVEGLLDLTSDPTERKVYEDLLSKLEN